MAHPPKHLYCSPSQLVYTLFVLLPFLKSFHNKGAYSGPRASHFPTCEKIKSFLVFICSDSVGKESACNVGDLGSIPGWGRSPGEGKSYPLQCSGLENPMGCIIHGVSKSWARWATFTFTASDKLPLIVFEKHSQGKGSQVKDKPSRGFSRKLQMMTFWAEKSSTPPWPFSCKGGAWQWGKWPCLKELAVLGMGWFP